MQSRKRLGNFQWSTIEKRNNTVLCKRGFELGKCLCWRRDEAETKHFGDPTKSESSKHRRRSSKLHVSNNQPLEFDRIRGIWEISSFDFGTSEHQTFVVSEI
jgi:hypothetical protein